MTKENNLWKWLSKVRFELKADLHICRVENSTMKGMPDVEGHLRGHGQFWIELKSAKRPARASTPIRFPTRDEQVEWLQKRWKIGGAAWMLCQVGSASEAKRYLISGGYAAEVHEGMTEERLERMSVLEPKASRSSFIRAATFP